ncbi:MAG: DUF3137 domain-containing protein [Sulfurospirillum sp.]|nr:DUF3137 domain-containing protein [Sulfurospirillum sp.]
MKTLASLQDFFYEEMYPQLLTLELQRQKIFSFLKKTIFLLLIFTVVAFLLLQNFFYDKLQFFILCVAFVVGVFSLIYHNKIQEFSANYKTLVIEKLVSFVSPSLQYAQNESIKRYEYEQSLLFLENVDRFKGEDKISGSIDGVNIEFSELHTEAKRKNSKGQTYFVTLFRGLFFVSEFNKHFYSKTFIFPDTIERYMGKAAHLLQSYDAHGELIKLDDNEFERKFRVYSSDQIEARYILSNAFMQHLLLLQEKIGKEISISFTNSKMFVAVHFKSPIFEPKIYKKVADFKEVQNYFETINYVVLIIKMLKLDQKIWSKV